MLNNIDIKHSLSNIKAIVVIKIDPNCNYSSGYHTSDFWSFMRIGFDGLHFFHCDGVSDNILSGMDLSPMNHSGGSRKVSISGVDEI